MAKHLLCLYLICAAVPGWGQLTDYSNLDNWAAHGAKQDESDKIPKKLRKKNNDPKIATVFFIHPTTYTREKAYEISWCARVADSVLNKQTDETTILFQASCFNEQSIVYAPRYRQAHIQSFFSGKPEAKAALDTAYNDIRAAFQYFLDYENKGMPIIIAAHSQGTVHAGRLIKEFFENKPLQKNLVAAYLIGMPVRKNYFTSFTPCKNAGDIDCFVSWRTFLNGHDEIYVRAEPKNSVFVTNPLNWSLDTNIISRKFNKGAVLLKFNKIYKKVNTAKVQNNILWISKPKFPFSFLVKNKRTNYHIADINLFYVNIRENVRERLQQFIAAKTN